ncbi:hypothetical protein U9M48_039211 [Paspalum notatum var. saurae]|uniref:Retroviral polymerase SH3-like domain-containing protein n=1 Tax=Paspalum notatum var. saurae TaxID=547442 RepID=A0AAQ3UIG9_PASNO
MAPSASSNGGVPVLRCPLLFDGTNYRVWVPRMRWHMRGLRLWEFLTGVLPCPPCPKALEHPVVPEKASDDEKQKLLDDFAALQKSYEAQFSAYRLWLDEDARAGSIVVASMQDQFAEKIVDFEWSHQIWSFLRDRYEPTSRSAYFAAIRREQLICHGDLIVDELYTRLSVDEYEPLRARLLARHPFVSLIDALTDVRNEETRLRFAGLLPSASALAARSSSSRPAVAPPSLPSSATTPSPSARGGGGGGLHCDYCGKDGHVEAFCYRKKKAQRSQTRPASQTSQISPASQPSTSISAGVSQRSSTDPVTQEMLMLLRRFAASSPFGTASIATLPAGSPGSTAASQSFTQGPLGRESLAQCQGCRLGKQIQLPYHSSESVSERPFDLVHLDVNIFLMLFVRSFLRIAHGTLAQFSCPGAHAQNGVAERKHCHLLETARALMLASSVPPHFWAEAVSTATYLINIQPSSALHGGIPLERLCGKAPDYSDLRLFGCVCYVLFAPRERTKLTAQSVECVFLGYSAEYKGYRCWDPVGRRIRISQNVVFDESHPFYPRPSSDASLPSLVDPLSFLFITDNAIACISSRSVPSPTVSSSGVVPPSVMPPVESPSESSSLPPDYTTKPPMTQVYTCRSASTSFEHTDELSSGPSAPSSDEPSSTSPAASSPEQLLGRGHRSQWQLAMAEEIAALERTGTWDLVPTPSHSLLDRASITDHKTEETPMERNLQLSATDGEPLDDPTRYRHIVGSLVYLGVTRPDIFYSVHILSQFVSAPTYLHYNHLLRVLRLSSCLVYLGVTRPDTSYSVHILSQFVSAPTQLYYSHFLRVLRYLRRTISRCLFFPRSSSLQLQAYYDATWASDSSDRRSLSAYCVFLGGFLIAWKTKKQTAVSRSSTEAELRAVALVTAEVTWLRWLLADFGVSMSISTPLLTDSTSTISIARDPEKHELTKHIGVDAYYTHA